MSAARPNYWEYIRVEELLSLQGGLEGEEARLSDDEVLFIVVHQVYELWFKLILRELSSIRDLFDAEHVREAEMSGAVQRMRRITVILGRCVDHFAVMETMPTQAYLSFRDKLFPASGFQSAQMRQMEVLLGLEESERIPLGFEGSYLKALEGEGGAVSPALERVRRQLAAGPSLKEALENWLLRTPIDGVGAGEQGAEEALDRFIASYLAAHAGQVDQTAEGALRHTDDAADRERLERRFAAEKQALVDFLAGDGSEAGARRRRVRAALLFLLAYRELPLLAWPATLVEALIELEQAFTVFRQRHARMVERVIGRRTGTGGSAGVDYLDQTALEYRVFRDLWAVRTFQIRPEANPSLARASFYGFRNG